MQRIQFWAMRTLNIVGQVPAALALAAFVFVWAIIGHITPTLAFVLIAVLVMAVLFVQLMKMADRKKAKAEQARAGTGLR